MFYKKSFTDELHKKISEQYFARFEVSYLDDTDYYKIVTPFLDCRNDYIVIYVQKQGDFFAISDDGEIEAEWMEPYLHEKQVQLFLGQFNSSQCLSHNKIQYSSKDGFYMNTIEKDLMAAIFSMIDCLVKYTGVIEFLRGKGYESNEHLQKL